MKKTLLFITTIVISLTSYAQYEGFENWTQNSILNLDDHETTVSERGLDGAPSLIQSTDAFTGTYSVRLETTVSPTFGDTVFGFFVSGDPDSFSPGQATAFNGVDSLIGYYKYDIAPGDSCAILAATTFSGTLTGGGEFYVPAGTQTTWKRFAYPIESLVSDSLLFAAASGDPLNNFNGIPGSWIQFDNVQIKKGSQTAVVLNGDFENWTAITWDEPNGWASSNFAAIGEPTMPVVKSTDMYAGNFAVELNTITNNNNDTINGLITNGVFNQFGFSGGQPYTSTPSAVEFYYKNSLSGVDTSWASIIFKNGGSVIAQYGGQLTAVGTYTLFSQPLSLPMTPDSLLIGIFSGENSGSQLYVDNIDFVFPAGITENLTVDQLISYPNPATNEIKIKFALNQDKNVTISLIDITGKELTNRTLGQLNAGIYRETFNTSSLSAGVYFFQFTLDGEKLTKKFIVK